MHRFLIESPHDLKDCALLLKEVKAMGYLHHFEWGCSAGDHTGWAIIELESEEDARLVVPPFVRKRARIVRLNRFSAEEVDLMHPK